MPYKPNEREYRAMPIMIREADPEQGAGTGMRVRGLFTTYEKPYLLYAFQDGSTRVEVWEQVSRDAFKEADETDVIMQYNHVGHVYARMSNNTLKLFDEDEGHAMEADLAGTTIGRQLYEEIAGGYTREMSMGFTIDALEKTERWENIDEPGEKLIILETITKIRKLYDVSAVSIPANPGTSIMPLTRSAYLDGVVEQARKEIAAKREAERKRKLIALEIEMEVNTSEND